ncbi:MAG TPA: hypothetical protein PLY86_05635 [bacterium]|nr:hypothetical protein [bacterium]
MVSCLYLLISPILAIGFLAVGDRFVRRFCMVEAGERPAVSLAAGMALVAVMLTLLGTFHVLNRVSAWLLFAVLCLDGVLWIRRNGRDIGSMAQTAWLNWSRQSRLGICVVMGICAVNAWFCLSPEIRHDPYDYHLTVANLYGVSGGIVEIPWHVFTYMPKYGEMLYAFVLLLGPDILGKLLHWLAGVGVLALTYALARRMGDRGTAVLAVFLATLIPLLSFIMTTCYVDLFVGLWALAAVLCLTCFDNRKSLLAGGFFLGMVLGTKYVAWGVIVPPVVFACLVCRAKECGVHKALARTAVLAVTALLIASPWLLYNLCWTGNPIYPMLPGVFGRHIPPCPEAEMFFRSHCPPDEALTLSGYGAYLGMRLSKLAGDGIVVFFTGLAASLFALFRKGDSLPRFLGIMTFLSGVIFLTATDNHDGRFVFPTLALCAVWTAWAWLTVTERVSEERHRRLLFIGGYLLAGVLSLFWISHRITQVEVFDQQITPRLSVSAREQVLRERFPGFDLVVWGNEYLLEDALVLGLGYPLRRCYISKNKYGYIPWLEEETGLDNAEHLAEILRKAGVTHIATPWPKLREDVDLSILLPSYLTEVRRSGERILYQLSCLP